MPDSLRRLAPLTGIVFAALLVVTFFFTPSAPSQHDTGVQVLAHFRLHHSAIVLGNFCGALAVIFFIFFAGTLRSFLRGQEGGEGLSAVALGGAVLLGAGGAIFSSLEWALSETRNSISPAAAEAINVLSNNLFWPFEAGLVVFSIAIGLAILRTAALPKWLGWVMIVVGVVGVTPVGFFAFFAVMIWSVIVAVMLYRRGGEPARPRDGGGRPGDLSSAAL
jgi:hypothetical protein